MYTIRLSNKVRKNLPYRDFHFLAKWGFTGHTQVVVMCNINLLSTKPT